MDDQTLYHDPAKGPRFRPNAVVRYLVSNRGVGLNDLPWDTFPQEDVDQFYQLIGYSLAGYEEMAQSGIVSGEAARRAVKAARDAGLPYQGGN